MTSVETVYVRLSWDIPSTDNGSPVEEYKIFVLESDGITYSEPAQSCDGQDPDLVASLQPSCLITFQELRSEPYLLEQGALVVAKVKAFNLNGWSPLSLQNTIGATIQVEPHKMTQVRSALGTLED